MPLAKPATAFTIKPVRFRFFLRMRFARDYFDSMANFEATRCWSAV